MGCLYEDATGYYLKIRYPRPRHLKTSSGHDKPKRKTVRLTGWSDDRAAWAAHHVEKLIHAVRMLRPVELSTIRWVQTDAPDNLRAALAELGLVDDLRTLGPAVDAWIHASASAVSAARLADLERLGAVLVAGLGRDCEVATITPEALAATFDPNQAHNTHAKHGRIARQFFRWAIARKLLETNPAADLAITFDAAADRVFVPAEDVLALIRCAPRFFPAAEGLEIAAALALARFGGLRVGEIPRVQLGDIDPRGKSFSVRDTKRGQLRIVPLFPEVAYALGPQLRVLGDRPAGDLLFPCLVLIGRRGLARRVLELIEAAGLKPWPRLFHNLRASRESELLEQFPQKDVLLWIGNTEAVAMKHYAITRDETFARAAETYAPTSPADSAEAAK